MLHYSNITHLENLPSSTLSGATGTVSLPWPSEGADRRFIMVCCVVYFLLFRFPAMSPVHYWLECSALYTVYIPVSCISHSQSLLCCSYAVFLFCGSLLWFLCLCFCWSCILLWAGDPGSMPVIGWPHCDWPEMMSNTIPPTKGPIFALLVKLFIYWN